MPASSAAVAIPAWTMLPWLRYAAWRCTPASRNGQPVRAVALQPFNFILNGN
jgi:hypothetical protein